MVGSQLPFDPRSTTLHVSLHALTASSLKSVFQTGLDMADRHIDVIEFNEIELRAEASRASDAIRRRVEAVINVSKGANTREVASKIGIEHVTLIRWVRAFNEGGYASLAAVNAGMSVDMNTEHDPDTLRKLAAEAHFPETRTRLMVLVSLYEGDTVAQVSETFRISPAIITRWRDDFNQKGVDIPREASVRLDADIVAASRTELRTVAEIADKLDGEAREKAEAILMSSRDISVARIAEAFGRPRSWVVATIKAFNFGGTYDLFGVSNHGPKMSAPPSATINLVEGVTAKMLMEAAEGQEGKAKEELTILAKVFLYKNRKEAAIASGASENRISTLIGKLRAEGLAAFVSEPSFRQLNADKIDEAARGYRDRVAAAKLFALARIVRGESFESVAEDTGTTRPILRNWMTRLEKYGVDAIPDGRVGLSVPEKPKIKSPAEIFVASITPPKQSAGKVKERIQAPKPRENIADRIREAVAATATTERPSLPFVSAAQRGVIRSMARDELYPGRNLALAMLAHLDGASAAQAAQQFDVSPMSIGVLSANLSPTLEAYAETRAKKLIGEAGITPTKVRKVSTDCPRGWLSKLRSVGYLSEGKTLREVGMLTNLDQATLLRYVEDITGGWYEVETRLNHRPRAVAAGMGR
jgi:transposase